jgi:glycosyltransferase involved in cell wall biosynthesis
VNKCKQFLERKRRFIINTTFSGDFFKDEPFSDLLESQDNMGKPFDVVIPIQNTNIFFRRNLISLYREIPVANLIVGDGGSTDRSLEILGEFPRVRILDHSHLKSLGASIKALVDEVSTEYFAYLHSDVFLPRGFYNTLRETPLKNRWVESNRSSLIVHEEIEEGYFLSERPYSGAQFGQSQLMKSSMSRIEDDFLYRNEDLVIRELVEQSGGEYVKVEDLMHLHQSVTKNSENEPKLKVAISRAQDTGWESKVADMQFRGIVKYTSPATERGKSYLVGHVNESLKQLFILGALDFEETIRWIEATNSDWLKHIRKPTRIRVAFLRFKNLISILLKERKH